MAHPPPSSFDVHDPSAEASAAGLDGLPPFGPEGLGERWEQLRRSVVRSPGRSVVVLVGTIAVLGVGWWFLRPPTPPVESSLPLAAAAAGPATPGAATTGPGAGGTTTSTAALPLVVQASGAVAHPGVYRVAPDARVDDLVRAAGGLAPDADQDRVNLAAPLADGERIWLPHRGEEDPPQVVAGSGGPAAGTGAGPTGSGTAAAPEVVDLNVATAEQLDTLPGVGPATAAAILAYRDEHGTFAAVDDLLEVRGIGDAKLEQLRPLVTV